MQAGGDRLVWLRTVLQRDGLVRTVEAARHLGVSEMTVRRDLSELDSLGVARRVRGGAVAVGATGIAERHDVAAKAKARIAVKLLPFVPQSGVVAFDASSTILRLATALEGARDLLVLTNGIETFAALSGKPGIKPVLTGGEDPCGTGSLVGPIAVRVTAAFLVSHAFCSAAGVDPETGSCEPTLEVADVKREMGRIAEETVLAVDSSKLGVRSAAVCHDWGAVGTLVTELDPADAELDRYQGLAKLL